MLRSPEVCAEQLRADLTEVSHLFIGVHVPVSVEGCANGVFTPEQDNVVCVVVMGDMRVPVP